MSYSFLLNKNFVFKSSAAIREEVIAFVAVTATGVLIIHNLVYVLFIYILNHSISVVNIVEETVNYRISSDSIVINLATVAGAVVALIWNYNGYRLFVFKGRHDIELS
jgi:putative flippase GtrA